MVISGVNTVTYNGDGINTAWPYTYLVTDDDEIKIQVNNADGTAVAITSDYYVDLVNSTVYYPGYAPGSEPPEAEQPPKVQTGQTITVYREVPMTQEADLGEAWPFSVIEHGLDKLTMIAQQINSGTKRTLDNALASMYQLADVVVDSRKLQHITDQLNTIDTKATEAAESESKAQGYKDAAANSAASAYTSATTADSVATALTDIYNDAIDQGTIVAPAVDKTLSVSGAAADAQVVGNFRAKTAGKNLFDPSQDILAGYIIDSSGDPSAYSGCDTSDYIEVDASTDYYFSNALNGYCSVVAYYDSTKTFISRDTGTVRKFTTPASTKYVRLSCTNVVGGLTNKVQLEEGTWFTDYEPFYKAQYINSNDEIAGKVEAAYNNSPYINLNRSIDAYSRNKYITPSNTWNRTVINGEQAYCVLIPVEPNDNVVIIGNKTYQNKCAFLRDVAADQNVHYCYERDDNGNIIYNGADPVENTGFTVASNKAYITSAPVDAKYMYLNRIVPMSGVLYDVFPQYIQIKGVDVYGVNEQVESLNYTTVFFDNFDGELDTDVWHFHTQPEDNTGRYRSRFVTDTDNAYTDSSSLVLKCSKSARSDLGNYTNSDGVTQGRDYVAPYISTAKSFALKNGKVSARMKFQRGLGANFAGAFWTFGQDGTWPYAHEMDIAETAVAKTTTDRTASDGTLIPAGSLAQSFANHTQYRDGVNNVNAKKDGYYEINYALKNGASWDPSQNFLQKNGIDITDWHVYSAVWDEENIYYYVDDILMNTVNAAAVNAEDMDGNANWSAAQYVCFNIKAMEWVTDDDASLFVDWVRIEKAESSPTTNVSHSDMTVAVNGSFYCAPTFTGTNEAYTITTNDTATIKIDEFLNDYNMLVHKVTGLSAGTATVNLVCASGRVGCTFTVTVS